MIDLTAVTVEDLERDPYPIYAELREHAPVAYMPCLDAWMVTSWATVEAACTDPVAFPASVAHSPTDRALGGISMMTTDGDPARRRRRPFDPTLRPRAVDATMASVFEQLCRERIDAIGRAGGGSVDLVKAYFEPVSVLSLAHGMGIADAVDGPTLVRWFGGLAAGVSNYEDDPAKSAHCAAISAEIDEVVTPLFEAQLDAPSGDLIGHLVGATEGSLEERLAFVMPSFKLVLLGGLQEPAHGGATVTERLLRHPDQLAAVRADPSLVPAAVEEGLRWTAPIGNLLRGVTPGTSLGGVEFGEDQRAILVVAAANRDREVWGETADAFDIRRPKKASLSFAIGPHYCIGHYFARAQLATAVGMLVERFPRLRLDPDEEPVYRGHEYRSPKTLRVLVD
ncbi:MAG TPA: cytochrome P450 [Candidatus Limnocylindrales bacterium]|nr:cytochrome P450 [Candidatus Limnocylindrales bacterium]